MKVEACGGGILLRVANRLPTLSAHQIDAAFGRLPIGRRLPTCPTTKSSQRAKKRHDVLAFTFRYMRL